MQFKKFLISKESKNNSCYVPEGEILIIRDIKNPKDYDSVKFEWYKKLSVKNKFGWVKETNPFFFEDFLNQYCSKIHRKHYEVIRTLLTDIKDFEEDTPVAASYFKRGIINSDLILKIHKVKFYEIK